MLYTYIHVDTTIIDPLDMCNAKKSTAYLIATQFSKQVVSENGTQIHLKWGPSSFPL